MCPFVAPENPMWLVGGPGSSKDLDLPPGYSLECSDPEVLILRCPHGEVVARFSAFGATAGAIEQEGRIHYRARSWPA
jgi:hypothetical protein